MPLSFHGINQNRHLLGIDVALFCILSIKLHGRSEDHRRLIRSRELHAAGKFAADDSTHG